MKNKKMSISDKMFMSMAITEVLEQSAHAITHCLTAIKWNHARGEIMVNFDEKHIVFFDSEHHPIIIAAMANIAEQRGFELLFVGDDEECDCANCKAERVKHN
jgi:hypothetical protein